VTELDLTRLGRHVAEREDAALAADDAGTSEGTRRFVAEYAAGTEREGGDAGAAALGREGHALGTGGAAGRGRQRWFGLGPQHGRRSRTGARGAGAPALGLRFGLAAMAAVVAVGLFALKEGVLAPAALSFTIGASGETGVLRDWASAPDDASLPIRFSDGTRVLLEPQARARVVALSERGAEVVIESGRAHLDVVPARAPVTGESPWRVSLGPFSVEVKGTRFDVEWDPRTDDFALDLFEGSVRVSGCQEGHAHTLVAGQGVRASCSQKRWSLVSVSEATGSSASGATGAGAASAGVAGAGPVAHAAPGAGDAPGEDAGGASVAAGEARAERGLGAPGEAGASAATGAAGAKVARGRGASAARAQQVSPRSWQALALRGHYSEAFERALDAGFDSECERVGASDLVLLGDTARLGGDAARARAAYLAARRRFDDSPAAAQAAFGLGRLAVKSNPREAIEWFERSLREAPKGPLAAAAHDWLFELVGETGTPSRRREAAQRYLEQHGDGAHAEDARRILEGNER